MFPEILAGYKKAWEERDANLVTGMFTRDATYLEDPFDKWPISGLRGIREYWAQVPRFQRNISFKHGPVFHLERSRVWGSEWEARYTKVKTRERIRLRGVLFCELAGRRIRRFWEYWHIRGGSPSFSASSVTRRPRRLFPRERNPAKPTGKRHEIAPAITHRL